MNAKKDDINQHDRIAVIMYLFTQFFIGVFEINVSLLKP